MDVLTLRIAGEQTCFFLVPEAFSYSLWLAVSWLEWTVRVRSIGDVY
jgi:hypothetical protein